MVDTKKEQMSGVAIVNQLMFVFNICIFGGVSGAGIFGTQYFGKGDYEGQKYTFRFKLYACGVITGIALLLFGFFDTQLISLYNQRNRKGQYPHIELFIPNVFFFPSCQHIYLLP